MESDEVYKEIIRVVTHSFKTDGTIPSCPVCRSRNISVISSMYEFTEMLCSNCNHLELADDYQIADWYSK